VGEECARGPIWDFNISLGNASYGTGETPTGWLYDVPNGVGQLWYPRLQQDPAYRLQHWDRYWQLRRGVLSTAEVEGDINAYANELLDGYAAPVGNNAPIPFKTRSLANIANTPFSERSNGPIPIAQPVAPHINRKWTT
jgi:hypothetical protein